MEVTERDIEFNKGYKVGFRDAMKAVDEVLAEAEEEEKAWAIALRRYFRRTFAPAYPMM